ncbi:P-loop containing nucleoside triphosphatehydrolases superfamily protein [Striga asiatica]|uniref:P-loop containing nucleoside triphosphatehydrolases superfamily protein n=1 Tax=Striga asiatica TaxID=4170 RepID=A0A5A7Q6R3_STRAF|nr:P-loop containing nucleoside triphosphatehydrolases superfamily protein [Striga asiatica]
MDELQKAYRSAVSQAQETTAKISSLASSLEKTNSASPSPSSSSGIGPPSYSLSADQSRLLLARPPRNFVSLWTCSKLCAVFFVAGIFVGYTLKKRVRRWASKLLRRLKDD